MAVILREAVKPNLLQTLEHTPVLVHAGPFGNIANGNSSMLADLIGIHAGDYLDHRGRVRRRHGRRAVLQHQVPGLGPHPRRRRGRGDRARAEGALGQVQDRRRPAAAARACSPRTRTTCSPARPTCASRSRTSGCTASRRSWRSTPSRPTTRRSGRRSPRSRPRPAPGPRCASTSPRAGRAPSSWPRRSPRRRTSRATFRLLYPDDVPLREKIETIATKVYGADGVDYSPLAANQLDSYERNGFGHLPVCIAKTHLSISSRPEAARRADRLAAAGPRGARPRSAPGSSTRSAATCAPCRACRRKPAAFRIDLDDDGEIVGLS